MYGTTLQIDNCMQSTSSFPISSGALIPCSFVLCTGLGTFMVIE